MLALKVLNEKQVMNLKNNPIRDFTKKRTNKINNRMMESDAEE